MKPALHAAWVTWLRRRLAAWIAPEIDIALEKRRLQRIAIDCGTSWTVAKRITHDFFCRTLHDDQ